MGRMMATGVVLLLVAGCAPMLGLVVATPTVSAMGTLPQTKKLPADHVLSSMTGRDCSAIHYEKTGEYCPAYSREIDRSQITCFKTLGDVECRQQPDRYSNGERILASPPPPIPLP